MKRTALILAGTSALALGVMAAPTLAQQRTQTPPPRTGLSSPDVAAPGPAEAAIVTSRSNIHRPSSVVVGPTVAPTDPAMPAAPDFAPGGDTPAPAEAAISTTRSNIKRPSLAEGAVPVTPVVTVPATPIPHR